MSVPAAQAHQQTALLRVQTRWQARTATLVLVGELDYATAPLLAGRLTTALARRPERVILDLAALTFIDCSGLTPIIRARNRLPQEVPLIMRSPRRRVRSLLALTGVDQTPGLHCA